MRNLNLEETFLNACKDGDIDKVNACISLGVNVNCIHSDFGWTGIEVSMIRENLDIMNILLSKPDINVNRAFSASECSMGYTPLMWWTCFVGEVETAKRLLSVPGIDINCQSRQGATAAMIAVNHNRVEIVKLLSEIDNVNWNFQTKSGWTAAMRAVYEGNMAPLRILKEIQSIDWNLTNSKGHSALSLALKAENHEAVKIILSIPSLEIDVNQLKEQNIPSDMIMESMRVMMDISNKANNNAKKLGECLGDKGTMDCPVCLIAFTAKRRVFMCGNGHFTCGRCKENIQNGLCPRCRGEFTGRAHDFENMLGGNNNI